MTPTPDLEVEALPAEGSDRLSERGSPIILDRGLADVVFEELPDFTLVDVLTDPVHSRLGEKGTERPVLEQYLSQYGIHAVGATAIEDLLDIRPVSFKPESGKGAVLTIKSTEEKTSDTYAVLKSPLFYGGGVKADRVTALAVIGDFKPGNKVYLVALQRTRREFYANEEPTLELSVYDISPHSDLGEYMLAGEPRVKFTHYRPHGVHYKSHCRDAVKAFEKEIAIRRREVAEHELRKAAESLSDYIAVEGDTFHLKAAGFDMPMPLRLGQPTPAQLGVIRGHVATNGYSEEERTRILSFLDKYRALSETNKRAA
jgi:ribosomal protein S20